MASFSLSKLSNLAAQAQAGRNSRINVFKGLAAEFCFQKQEQLMKRKTPFAEKPLYEHRR